MQLAKLFTRAFSQFRATPTSEIKPLKVYYGTPKAAFRHILERNNNQMVLPVLNFYATDYTRLKGREPANRQLRIGGANSYNKETGKIVQTRPPMQFNVNYQFTLFCNNQKEMYSMLHKMFAQFPKGEASIPWYPDKENYPDVFLWMPLRWEDQIQDTTELEGFNTKETKDITKNTFVINGDIVVPYESWEVDYVAGVGLLEFVWDDKTNRMHQNYVLSSDHTDVKFEAGTFNLKIKLFTPA